MQTRLRAVNIISELSRKGAIFRGSAQETSRVACSGSLAKPALVQPAKSSICCECKGQRTAPAALQRNCKGLFTSLIQSTRQLLVQPERPALHSPCVPQRGVRICGPSNTLSVYAYMAEVDLMPYQFRKSERQSRISTAGVLV